MMSISGAITYAALGGMDEELKEELLHELMLAHKSIFMYKNHLLRAFCQNYFWDMMTTEKDETIAFCTQGNQKCIISLVLKHCDHLCKCNLLYATFPPFTHFLLCYKKSEFAFLRLGDEIPYGGLP